MVSCECNELMGGKTEKKESRFVAEWMEWK